MDTKKRSLVRSKKTLLTITSLLAKEGVSDLVPGGGLLFDCAKALFDHGKKYVSDRNEERLAQFHRLLLDGPQDNDQVRELLNGEFDMADYHAILASCLQDIENEKTEQYARLLQSFILRASPDEEKKLFIQAAKTLSMFDLRYLREMFIQGKHDLMTAGGATQQVMQLLQTTNSIKRISLSRFEYLGFLNDKKTDISDFAKEFIVRAFEGKELMPESIDRKPWTGISLLIICFEIGNKVHSRIYMLLQEGLWNCQIKSSIQILDSQRRNPVIFFSGGILLVGDKPITGTFLEGVKRFAEKRPVARIDVTEIGEKVEFDSINFYERYSLVSCDAGSERNMISSIISRLIS